MAKGEFVHEDWSPDGSLIAYEFDSDATVNQIQIMRPDGSHVVDLTGDRKRCETEPSFTPGGRHFVFIRSGCGNGRGAQIWKMDIHGRHRRKIADTPAMTDMFVSRSPGGAASASQILPPWYRRVLHRVDQGEKLSAAGGFVYVVRGDDGMIAETAQPPRRRWWLLIPFGVLALALVLVGAHIFGAVTHTCNDLERAAFLEFPEYGGTAVQPGSDIDAGGCVASFQTPASHEDVIRYYKHQLEQHGWTTQDFEEGAPEGGVGSAGGESLPASIALSAVPSCSSAICTGSLTESRGNLLFGVSFEATEGSTSVVIRVNEV